MNQLSLLMYWGGVAGNFGGLSIFLGIVFVVVAVITYIIHMLMINDLAFSLRYTNDNSAEIKAIWEKEKPRLPYVWLVLGVLLWVLSAFCPDKDTMYAIAASQMGEKALQSPLAGKTEKALESWLDRQLTPAVDPTPVADKDK